MNDLFRLTAREAVARLGAGEISPLDLIDAAAARIAETDEAVNAMPTLCLDRARERAKALMAAPPAAPGGDYLYGLPIAVKDLTDVAGVRTTYGSPIYADHVPETSDLSIRHLEAKGAVVIGKSNTPEFGAGSNTFNEVFGTTTNPWDTTTTCGGSSGGSAAALAAGQVWLATGSDLGGSLRIPASFCGVVGLRPSPGRVGHGPSALPFETMPVQGPMGRTVGDVALLLDAMAGQFAADPLSQPAPATPFLAAVDAPAAPGRVAFSPDLGIVPVDREVREICAAAAARFAEFGAAVAEDCIDFTGAGDTFQVLRAAQFAAGKAPLLETYRGQLKPDVIWNIEKGLALTADEIGRAMRQRAALYARTCTFFETYDLLLCPTVLTPPFDHLVRYLTEIDGTEFDNYVDWLAMTFAITLTTCPAISVPCGFTAAGLPVGLQIMAPMHGEAALLSAAALFEQAAGLAKLTPIDPRPAARPAA